ncbi:helix-turn-helix domain-containing protein [Streptomyces violascens]|uniref:helix-turn-helix domain-containing protein n=1 Tax=Streptomyces violascens TaxID=67381 RepID=UPI0036502290
MGEKIGGTCPAIQGIFSRGDICRFHMDRPNCDYYPMSEHPNELTRMLREWRRRQDPNEVAGFTARYGRRRKHGLTQKEVAELTGVSERWYNKLERAVSAPYSDDFLDRVSRILNLDDDERHALFVYAVAREPAPRPRPDISSLDPYMVDYVRQHEMPAYISDQAWDLRIYNNEAMKQFPWMKYGINIMVWVLAFPEAKFQLIDWEDAWAKPMAAQLRMAAAQHRDNARLAEVVREVRERDEAARRVFDNDVTSYTHPDGSHRRMYLPHHADKEFEVVWLAFAPLRDQSLRFIVSIPADTSDQPASAAIPEAMPSASLGAPSMPASTYAEATAL